MELSRKLFAQYYVQAVLKIHTNYNLILRKLNKLSLYLKIQRSKYKSPFPPKWYSNKRQNHKTDRLLLFFSQMPIFESTAVYQFAYKTSYTPAIEFTGGNSNDLSIMFQSTNHHQSYLSHTHCAWVHSLARCSPRLADLPALRPWRAATQDLGGNNLRVSHRGPSDSWLPPWLLQWAGGDSRVAEPTWGRGAGKEDHKKTMTVCINVKGGWHDTNRIMQIDLSIKAKFPTTNN